MKALVIEDNEILSRNIVRYLSSRDIHTQASLDGKDGFYQASTKYFDVIILDINLPEKDGLSICRELREAGKDTPIIMLTSRGTNEDIIAGLDIGADDYLIKPFEYDELVARMHALIRRNLKNKSTTSITVWDVSIFIENGEVFQNKKEIPLSRKEFKLLKYLAQNRGNIVSKENIYERVWGESENDFTAGKTLEVYIGYLRKKLGKEFIQTKNGQGYLIP